MADVIAAVTVDLAYALHAMCKEINARIRAAERNHRPPRGAPASWQNRYDRRVLHKDRRITVILENIHMCMEELEAGGGLISSAAPPVAACVSASRSLGRARMRSTPRRKWKRCRSESSREHLESLNRATQLHTYSSRASNKLKQVDSRRFRDEHFGDQREVSVTALAQALRHECDNKGGGVDVDTATGICKTCFSRGDVVAVRLQPKSSTRRPFPRR